MWYRSKAITISYQMERILNEMYASLVLSVGSSSPVFFDAVECVAILDVTMQLSCQDPVLEACIHWRINHGLDVWKRGDSSASQKNPAGLLPHCAEKLSLPVLHISCIVHILDRHEYPISPHNQCGHQASKQRDPCQASEQVC